MTHTTTLQRQGQHSRTGTIDLAPRGTFDIEMWLCAPPIPGDQQRAIVRLKQGDTVWETAMSLFPAQAYPEPADAFWHGYATFGHGDTWTYRLRGELVDGEFRLTFDPDVKQRYRGEYATLDADGRLVLPKVAAK